MIESHTLHLFLVHEFHEILQKRKKRLDVFSQGIFLPILKKIQTLVAELQVLTDRQTDRPMTRHGKITP